MALNKESALRMSKEKLIKNFAVLKMEHILDKVVKTSLQVFNDELKVKLKDHKEQKLLYS